MSSIISRRIRVGNRFEPQQHLHAKFLTRTLLFVVSCVFIYIRRYNIIHISLFRRDKQRIFPIRQHQYLCNIFRIIFHNSASSGRLHQEMANWQSKFTRPSRVPFKRSLENCAGEREMERGGGGEGAGGSLKGNYFSVCFGCPFVLQPLAKGAGEKGQQGEVNSIWQSTLHEDAVKFIGDSCTLHGAT